MSGNDLGFRPKASMCFLIFFPEISYSEVDNKKDEQAAGSSKIVFFMESTPDMASSNCTHVTKVIVAQPVNRIVFR